ncbi:hypothetical protein [Nitrosomonas sp. Nm132]|uniref:hypothetical protein n=1 Tax=Nitrosomonas sp. Nm132 TaxID=1881053 RepID=UPI000B8197AD|nr:hypothetical protein [Nitrosomonas sp. Nm132]
MKNRILRYAQTRRTLVLVGIRLITDILCQNLKIDLTLARTRWLAVNILQPAHNARNANTNPNIS